MQQCGKVPPGGLSLKHCAWPTLSMQVDFHSFEGILYTTPGLGWLLQSGLRRFLSAWVIGCAQVAARAIPAAEAWLRRTLPGVGARLDGWKAGAARLWWRQAPPVAWRRVPAPYDPSL